MLQGYGQITDKTAGRDPRCEPPQRSFDKTEQATWRGKPKHWLDFQGQGRPIKQRFRIIKAKVSGTADIFRPPECFGPECDSPVRGIRRKDKITRRKFGRKIKRGP